MKSIFLFISVMVVTVLTTHAQTQEEIDEALKYYPLEVGNYWEYIYVISNSFTGSSDTTYFSIEVTADTTLNNGTSYSKMRYVNRPQSFESHYEFDISINSNSQQVGYYLERADQLTANVYQWSPTSSDQYSEVLIDSLLTNLWETTSAVRWPPPGYHTERVQYLSDQIIIFGIEINMMLFTLLSAIPIDYILGEKFGLIGAGGGEGTISAGIGLIYFRDHLGTEYGESFDVSTPTPTEIPQRAALLSNYPNPFNPSTTIPYELNQRADVRLEVYDMLGRRVALLVNETRQAGRHNAVFDSGSLSSGVYIARLVAGEQVFSRKMVLVK